MPPVWKNTSIHLTEESRFTVEGAYMEDSLLVSGPGSDTHYGGLYFVKRSGWMGGTEVWCVDRLGSRGIDVDEKMLVRSLRADGHMAITVYGDTNALTIISDKGGNIHDVRIFDGKIYAVSTSTNEILVLNDEGSIIKTYTFPGGPDSWHINGLDQWDGRLVACAFGRFEGEGGYEGKTKGAGLIFDVETQKDVWTGLTGPYTPRCDSKGNKYVCDTGNKRLLIRRNNGGEKVVDFKDAFPRGLAIGSGLIYVGLSYLTATQHAAPTSKIVLIDMETYEITGQVTVDIPEIYDLAVVEK